MPYKLLLQYMASMYEYKYNVVPISDITKPMSNKLFKDYYTTVKLLSGFDMAGELNDIIFQMLRDGMFVGFMYNSEEDGLFLMPLDLRYCRIYGKTPEGQWIVYFDATYFDQGNNKDFVTDGDDQGTGLWDPCFVDGYNNYKNGGRDYQWFMLPPQLTACFICSPSDEFYMPLPYFLPLFKSLLQLLDTETLIANKNELQNYKLILNKIPFLKNTEDVDDFAVSLDMLNYFQEMQQAAVPNNVGIGTTPCDVEVVSFEKSTSTADTDELSNAMNNLFANAGINRLIISSGSSSNANGIKYSIANDLGKISIWVRRIQSWLNYFIKKNITENCQIQIFDLTRYNHDDFVAEKKQAATLGGSKTDYLIALGDDPLILANKLKFEKDILKIQDYMDPLQTSYTQSGDKGGAPTKDEGDLSPEGTSTRDSGKNEDKGNK